MACLVTTFCVVQRNMVLLSKQPTPRSSDGRMLLSPRVQTSRLAAIELPSDASRPLVPSDMPREYLEHAARLRKLSASHALLGRSRWHAHSLSPHHRH